MKLIQQCSQRVRWGQAIIDIMRRYRAAHGRFPNLVYPRRYSEKIQWRKLFDLNPDFVVFSDKVAVRAFIADRVGKDFLPTCLWVGNDAQEIPFDHIAPPYFIKSTHGTGNVAYVADTPDAARQVDLVRKAQRWLALNHGRKSHERAYVNVPPRIIVERALVNSDGSPPIEVKAFVFDGQVQTFQVIQVNKERSTRLRCHLTRAWKPLCWTIQKEPPMSRPPAVPHRLAEIVHVAETLAQGCDHLRIDMYDVDEHLYVGEITVYSQSGLRAFTPDEADFVLGDFWKIQHAPWRAAKALICGAACPA